MAQTLLVTSGKGGVGKSTVTQLLGRALAAQGQNVLILELDSGLRGMDLTFGVSDRVVYDLADVLLGRCKPFKAITVVDVPKGNLHLIAAPVNRRFIPQVESLIRLLEGLAGCYDFLILDAAAGLGLLFDIAAGVCDLALVVTQCDPVSVRDAAAAVQALGKKPVRLVINRFKSNQLGGAIPYIDTVIDTVRARLISVIPSDDMLALAMANGGVPPDSHALREFVDFSRRILGEEVLLNTKRLR